MDAASAAAWILRRGSWLSKPLKPQTPREALLQEALEQAVLAASAAYCASWTDPAVAALGISALRAATKASRDKRVRDWVAASNAAHGSSVPSAVVVRRWNTVGEIVPEVGARIEDIGQPGGEDYSRVWCYRWRRRCGGKFGLLRTKEPLPLATKRDKAGDGGTFSGFFVAQTEK